MGAGRLAEAHSIALESHPSRRGGQSREGAECTHLGGFGVTCVMGHKGRREGLLPPFRAAVLPALRPGAARASAGRRCDPTARSRVPPAPRALLPLPRHLPHVSRLPCSLRRPPQARPACFSFSPAHASPGGVPGCSHQR